MNILVTTLMEKNQLKELLEPIVHVKAINKIHVVRDTPGLNQDKVIFHTIPPIFDKFFFSMLFKLLLMFNILINNRVNLIIGFNPIPHGFNAIICSKLFKIKSCISVLGSPQYWDNTKTPNAEWKQNKINNSNFNKTLKKIILFLLNKSDFVTVCGSNSRKSLIDFGINEHKIKILPNTVDTNYFIRKKDEVFFDILYLGRIVKFPKNVDLVIQTINILKKVIPNIKVAIVGDGPALKEMKKLSKKLKLRRNIFFFGYQKNTLFFYQKSKIFITCSESEGLPLTMIEAMSVGLPAVISNVGDINDVIKDGNNSFLINDIRNIETYKSKIVYLLRNHSKYEEISLNATKTIKDRYSYNSATSFWMKNILDKI